MMLYLDTSAHVKQYINEAGSADVKQSIADALFVGVALISRAEMEAALAKYIRMGTLTNEFALSKLTEYRYDWQHLVKIPTTESVVIHAGGLAWQYGLRGYDAVHLSSALAWRDAMDEAVTMATFDKRLWQAASESGLDAFPADLTPFTLPKSSS